MFNRVLNIDIIFAKFDRKSPCLFLPVPMLVIEMDERFGMLLHKLMYIFNQDGEEIIMLQSLELKIEKIILKCTCMLVVTRFMCKILFNLGTIYLSVALSVQCFCVFLVLSSNSLKGKMWYCE